MSIKNVCAITKYDREKIDELIKDNDSYLMLMGFLDEAINDNKAKDILKNFSIAIDKKTFVCYYMANKF